MHVSGHAGETELVKLLKPYYVQGVSETMMRFGRDYDGGYILPKIIMKKSDAVMSYGVADDVSFEIAIINEFGKEVYAFDCGIKESPEKNDKLHFFPECIATDETVNSDQESSGIVSSYNNQIKRLKLGNKKIFIKMDIEGAEYGSFYTIEKKLLKNIQGIVIEVHNLINNPEAVKLLSFFNEHFVLVHLHANNAGPEITDGRAFPDTMELTYVNKKYAKSKVPSKEKYPTSLDRPNEARNKDFILDYWE